MARRGASSRERDAETMSKLVCTAGMNRGDEFPLSEGNNVLGRSKDECQIALFDKKCSRIHCQIIKKGSYYAIEDLNSRNGTYVNGKALLKKSPIRPGDHIHIGKSIFILSEKAVGGLLQQTATEVAAELQDKRFDKLMGAATRDAVHHVEAHERTLQAQEAKRKGPEGVRGFFARLLRRKA
jgi:pSer/pThr/pTyr-binding forkhead associated (FHA) protein